jgi:hypothetical protein
VGNPAWKHRVRVPAATAYCVNWRLGRTIKEELAAKTIFNFAPGDFPLIDQASTAPFALPICARRATGAPLVAGTGTVKMSAAGGGTQFQIVQPIPGLASLHVDIGTGVAAMLTPTIDGRRLSAADGADRVVPYTCPNAICAPGDASYIQECNWEGLTPAHHKVGFQGGTADFQMNFDGRFATVGIEPALFVRATGTLNGTAFDQRDYFKLIYSPTTNHHFIRHFAVLFDAPIGGACGLEVENISAGIDATPHVYTVTCTLDHIAELKITSGPTIEK